MKITKPTLIIKKEQVIANIEKMSAKAKSHNLFFRPHFKTHQSRVIGEWFREVDIRAITVSSVEMAEYFQADGWQDITIAFPLNILEIGKINRLAGKCDLKILIVNKESVRSLAENLINEVSFFIEIDNGYNRTGLDPADIDGINEILEITRDCELLDFKGFLTHSGNAYQTRSKDDLEKIHLKTLESMIFLKEKYRTQYPELILSLGDTPCCSILDDFSGIDEIRPGNFIFFDLMQEQIGSCSMEEIAVALACPVVAKNAKRLEIAIYGGAIHLSKEYILDEAGNKVFGRIVQLNESGWSTPQEDTFITSLSQEHGIIKTVKEFYNQIKIGDLLGVLPVHSCLTANVMEEYATLDDEIIDHL